MGTSGYTDLTSPITHRNGLNEDASKHTSYLKYSTSQSDPGKDVYLGFKKQGETDCSGNYSSANLQSQYNISTDTPGCSAIVESPDDTCGKIKFTLSDNTSGSDRTVVYKCGGYELFKVNQGVPEPDEPDPSGGSTESPSTFSIEVTKIASWSMGNIEFNGVVTSTATKFDIMEVPGSASEITIPISINMNNDMMGKADDFEFKILYDNLQCTDISNPVHFEAKQPGTITKYIYDRKTVSSTDKYLCGTLIFSTNDKSGRIWIDYQGSTGDISFSKTDTVNVTPSITAKFGSGTSERTLTIKFTLNQL